MKSYHDIPVHDTRDQSFSETIEFGKESDLEQEPEPIWNFPTAKLPTEDSNLNSLAAKLLTEDSGSQFIPVTKPPRKPRKPVENPPEHDFAIPKGTSEARILGKTYFSVRLYTQNPSTYTLFRVIAQINYYLHICPGK